MSTLCKHCSSVHCQDYQHCQNSLNEIKKLKEQVYRLRKRVGKDYLNENKRLETENKALKEKRYDIRLKNVEESRDELLEAYKQHRLEACRLGVREELIRKAESQKEKESK